MKLERGQVAVVTGAAGGLGLALAEALVRRGLRVALVDRDAAGLEQAAAALGPGVSTHRVDVSVRAELEALPAAVLAAHGQVDLLINNAGVSVGGTLQETSMDDYAWIFGVNVLGLIHGCKVFLPELLRRPRAHILNLSSSFGLVGFPGKTAYAASKFAVRGFSESLAAELEGGPVGLSCAFPGAVVTNIVRSSRVASERGRGLEDAYLREKGMAASAAAEGLLAGVEAGRFRIVLGGDARGLDLAARVLAGAWPRLIGKRRGTIPFYEEP